MTPTQFQTLLKSAGFYTGALDGKWGPQTSKACQGWFRSGVDLDKPQTVQRTSTHGRSDLILSEGLRLKAYKDSVGVWTIGVGHAATSGRSPIPHFGMTISAEQAKAILDADLREVYEPDVREALGPVPQTVFDGAVSFHFNTGSIDTASWVDSYLAGEMVEARRRFMLWRKPSEIINRRKREAELIFDGVYAT